LRAAAAGSPVLLYLVNETGVWARSADGKLSRSIARGPVQEAIYDPKLDLLWVRRSGKVEVMDLRQPKPKAIPIVTEISDLGEINVPSVGKQTLTTPKVCVVPGSVDITGGSSPSVGVRGFDEGEPPTPKLVGKAWLTKEANREPRAIKLEKASLPAFGTEAVVKLPGKVAKCAEDPKECGTAVAFGASGWQLVFAGEDEGEDCKHYRCLLRDPATGKMGKPPLPAKWSDDAKPNLVGECGLYRFDPSGKWYAIDTKLCAVGGTCQTIKEMIPLGWLDGGQNVGTDG
jgi:hypothetical protein